MGREAHAWLKVGCVSALAGFCLTLLAAAALWFARRSTAPAAPSLTPASTHTPRPSPMLTARPSPTLAPAPLPTATDPAAEALAQADRLLNEEGQPQEMLDLLLPVLPQ